MQLCAWQGVHSFVLRRLGPFVIAFNLTRATMAAAACSGCRIFRPARAEFKFAAIRRLTTTAPA